jgi:glucose uptake protein GlcU
MNLFVIITASFLIATSVGMFCTNNAGRNKHDDNNGRFYYILTVVAGVIYTIQNVVLLMREVS